MFQVDVQYAYRQGQVPTVQQISKWVNAALPDDSGHTELVVRIVDYAESAMLNERYRGRNKPTNVLSFPFDIASHLPVSLLGDLAICAPLVESEAREQKKRCEAHWAHLLVHGVLHLLGYEHELDEDAAVMENQEIQILTSLGYSNPYQEVITE